MIAVKTEYANALTYIEMFHSAACWCNTADAKTKYELLNSRAAKMDAVKGKFVFMFQVLDGKISIIHGPRMEKSSLLMNCLCI